MKKTILLLSLIIPLSAISQVKTIEYDFSKPDRPIYNPNHRYVKNGEDVIFKITNINKQLYDVMLNGEIVSYRGTVPDALKPILGLSSLSTEEVAADTKSMIERIDNADPTPYERYIVKYNDFKEAVEFLEETKTLYNQIQEQSQKEIDGINTVTNTTNAIQGFMSAYTAIPLVDMVQLLLTDVENAHDEEVLAFAQFSELQERNAKKLQRIEEAFLNKDGSALDAFHGSPLLTVPEKATITLAKTLHEQAASVKNEIDAFDYKELVKKISKLYNSTSSTLNYEASKLVQADEDEVKFSYKVTPKTDLDYAAPDRNVDASTTLWVKGGWNIRFSSGVAFTTLGLLNSSFRQGDVNLEDGTIDTTRTQLIRNRKNDWWIPNSAAYVHFSTRLKKYYSVGVSVGATLDFKDFESSNLNVGFSQIFGKKYSFALTVGLALGKVDVLDGKYDKESVYMKSEINADELTTSAFRAGLFFGLSFNFAQLDITKTK